VALVTSRSSTVRPEFFDAPAQRHISGAQMPKSLDIYLTAEERHFVEPGGGKSSLFGERGPNEY
jgi:hypothetical protein